MALRTTIDAAASEFCPGADQRGYPRSFDGNNDGLIACDMGAHDVSSVFFIDGIEGH